MRRRRARVLRRRIRPVVLLVGGGLLALTLAFGDHPLGPAISESRFEPVGARGISVTGLVDVFDDSHHHVAIEFDPKELQRIVTAYVKTGEHRYLEATVTIDGTRLDHVGVRLKGNSTLQRAVYFDEPDGVDPSRVRPGIGRTPEALPLLLRFDWFVDEQRYQGIDELALRLPFPGEPAGLNEAAALDLVGAEGLPTQRHAFADVTVNGRAAHLRLLVEVPNTEWTEDELGQGGTLYRATGEAVFSDQGDDPRKYASMYEQITNRSRTDLTPVVDLITWAERADDATFARDLDQHVDVDSLARYVAVHAALMNADELGGGGRNYYLWIDDRTGRATVLSWDLNLALYPGLPLEERRLEAASRPPSGGVVGPDGVLTFEVEPIETRPPNDHNLLRTRFLQVPEFRAEVRRQFRDVCDDFFAGGDLRAALDRAVAGASASDAVPKAALASEVRRFEQAIQLAAKNCADPDLRGYLD